MQLSLRLWQQIDPKDDQEINDALAQMGDNHYPSLPLAIRMLTILSEEGESKRNQTVVDAIDQSDAANLSELLATALGDMGEDIAADTPPHRLLANSLNATAVYCSNAAPKAINTASSQAPSSLPCKTSSAAIARKSITWEKTLQLFRAFTPCSSEAKHGYARSRWRSRPATKPTAD